MRFSASNEPQFKDRLTHSSDFDFIIDEEGDKHLLLKNVTFKIEPTDRDSLYFSIQKEANGASYKDAQANAQQIKYAPIIDSNRIQLNSYLTTPAIKNIRIKRLPSLFLSLKANYIYRFFRAPHSRVEYSQ